jgi:phosphohistidine phosphatase
VAAGLALARLGLELDACYTSPKARAVDTAHLACQALNVVPQVVDVLADGFDAEDALELLMAHDHHARVLMIGHNPSFEQVVHDLTGGRVDFKKGGVVAIRMEQRRIGVLIVVLRPREAESLAVGA